MDKTNNLEPGVDVYNTLTGEVMTYTGIVYSASGKFVYGYDDYKRLVEWPYEQSEMV